MTGLDRATEPVDFAALYDQHSEYAARRVAGSFEQAQVLLEATEFKIPNLVGLLPLGKVLNSVLEIGCATGELIGNFPVALGGRRVGCDISPANTEAASARFTDVEFFAGDFAHMPAVHFEGVVLSDVLEHVEDDAEFLRRAAELGDYTLVNLPLEVNWLNNRRNYGPDDESGHLRRYSLREGLNLFERAGLTVVTRRQVWIHEEAVDAKRRELRCQYFSHGFTGSLPVRLTKQAVLMATRHAKPVGRRLFASNLFAIATKDAG
jgi:SAM-dependent methyltransferase